MAYLGCMVNGKPGTRSFKCKELINNDKSDWIIVENTHEPIISKKDFDEVQRMRETKRKPTTTEAPLIFAKALKTEISYIIIICVTNKPLRKGACYGY